MAGLPTLTTLRLRLRPCRSEDLDALHALWTEPAVRRYLWDDVVLARELAAEVLARSIADAERGLGLWIVTARDRDVAIGFCGLRSIDGSSDVELLYGLSATYWGQGLATEASRAVLRYGFEQGNLATVWARTDRPNRDSVAVIERLGMVPSPRPDTPDGLSYCITRAAYADRA